MFVLSSNIVFTSLRWNMQSSISIEATLFERTSEPTFFYLKHEVQVNDIYN
jgi:hypothetical protein